MICKKRIPRTEKKDLERKENDTNKQKDLQRKEEKNVCKERNTIQTNKRIYKGKYKQRKNVQRWKSTWFAPFHFFLGPRCEAANVSGELLIFSFIVHISPQLWHKVGAYFVPFYHFGSQFLAGWAKSYKFPRELTESASEDLPAKGIIKDRIVCLDSRTNDYSGYDSF